MKNLHFNQNGWQEIGQHFTIFPDGMIVTGRSLFYSIQRVIVYKVFIVRVPEIKNFILNGTTKKGAKTFSFLLLLKLK